MSINQHVAVVYGGPSPEYEVSIVTGLQSAQILANAGVKVSRIYWDPKGDWFLADESSEPESYLEGAPPSSNKLEVRLGSRPGFYARRGLRSTRLDIDVVLNCLHGGIGEGGGAAALFEMLGLPATGGSISAASAGMDKLLFGAIMRDAGIPTLPRLLVSDQTEPSFGPGPYIIKPRLGGSSIGIHVVDDIETARVLSRTDVHCRVNGAVVEPYRPDLVDINVAYRTYPTFATTQLERPIRRTESVDDSFLTYAEKYMQDASPGMSSAAKEFPAKVDTSVKEEAQRLTRAVADAIGLSGMARVDFLFNEATTELFVNEINSIPGQMALYLWSYDIDPSDVLLGMLTEALAQPPVNSPAGYEDGAILRSSRRVSAKLDDLREH